MNIIKTLSLFILMSLLPSLALYLIFDGFNFKWVMVTYLLLWGIVYLYLDKFLLTLLKGREVMDTDEHLLFQSLKNESYKMKLPPPKVYLYTGFTKKCFVLQSRNEWTVVIERSLLNIMTEAQKKELARFVFRYKNTNMALIQTKVMGICTLLFTGIQLILSNVFFLKENSRVFKVLFVFVLGLVRPLLLPVEYLGKKQKSIPVGLDLKPIYNQLNFETNGLNDYISLQILSEISNSDLMVSYLEGFPILENCRFNESEF